MRAFLRHLRAEPPRPASYRAANYVPLKPWQVRERRFTRRGRRGVDAAEVAEFLGQVADDLAEVYAALGSSRRETERIKDALRCWQSERTREDLAARW
ncbi:DivIVA domain-containing protein [Micromonospora sp. NPDC050276]|uniref:DivIVA domain-containing protein n=1 Tax=Micromonospora sp. NPDC050276 TaxID=3364278 RepID=UPI0037AC9D98